MPLNSYARLALCACLAAYGASAGITAASAAASSVSVAKFTAVPNPTGLQFGFWEVYNKQAYTLEYMGKRPTGRVGFDSWNKFETSPGTYQFPDATAYQRAHRYGETVYGAINISFTHRITPGKQTIPEFYVNDITNPETREAAKRFLRAYVQNVLQQVGSLVLTIDYEIVSNYRLSAPNSEARAAEWGAWYVEAAAVARQAAAEIGMEGQLKLQPIVNGNPFAYGNPIALGPVHNQWLVDVVEASDALALDTYFSDPDKAPDDPAGTIDIIQFWIDNYANGKDVVVTENGFTTITEHDPTITREQRDWKYTGTEEEQATYYRALFPRLAAENRPEGAFHNQLRSFNIWSIIDNTLKPEDDGDRYFGVVRDDGTAKPGAAVVQSALATLENEDFHRPYRVATTGADVTALLGAGAPGVPLEYRSGDDFEFLRYTDTALPPAQSYTLKVVLQQAGNVVVSVNNRAWLYADETTVHELNVTPYCTPGAANTIDIYTTGPSFPVTQRVTSVKLLRN